jgi:regulatory protein
VSGEGAREGGRALELAYRALSSRDRTEAELRRFLTRRGVEPREAEAAVSELRAARLLDDAGYARRYAHDRRVLDRWGSERIARGLERRGVAPELVARAVGDVDRAAEERAARSLLEERFPALQADDAERDRAWRLLVRRGYGPELAYEAVRAHEREASSGRRAGRDPAGAGPALP